MSDEIISEDDISKVVEESKKLVAMGQELVERKKEDTNKLPVNNNDAKLRLGDLGEHNKISKKEVEEIFDQIDGFLFKIKGCIFRVSYVHYGQRKFTAELINEKKD